VHVARWLELRLGRWDRKSIRLYQYCWPYTYHCRLQYFGPPRVFKLYYVLCGRVSVGARQQQPTPRVHTRACGACAHSVRNVCRCGVPCSVPCCARARARACPSVFIFGDFHTQRGRGDITDPRNRTLASIYRSRGAKIKRQPCVARVCVSRTVTCHAGIHARTALTISRCQTDTLCDEERTLY
jgi:hypothetical protein